MKAKYFIIFLLVLSNSIWAQFTVTPGAQIYLSGNAQLTLNNTDLINNGIFTAGTGTISFTGNTSSAISGSQPVQFYNVEINKTAGSSVILQRGIGIIQQLNFISGFFNLNNYDADLGTSGVLNGEQETSRVIGSNGGQLLFSAVLNAPSAVNPGNMGAIITSSQNMGNVIIKRGHQQQVNGSGLGSSVLRYFDILPVNNTSLNATLRFQYFDGELNSFDENTVEFWKSTDMTNWTNEGFNSRNTTSNYVEKININSFSRWTLSSISNPLPVHFILFNTKCEGNTVFINWKTAQEQNSSHFNIERSTDGISWTVIGNQPAAGNSGIERTYSFTDNNPAQKNFYRIAQYDIDGRKLYTSILKASCDVSEIIKVWPNPFSEIVFVNIYTNSRSQATIKVFDSKGALIKIQETTLLQGINLVNIDLEKLSGGIYQLIIEWNNGQMKKTVQVVKQ